MEPNARSEGTIKAATQPHPIGIRLLGKTQENTKHIANAGE